MDAQDSASAGEGAIAAKPKSELRLRVISAVFLALAALGSAWLGGWVFVLVWGVIGSLIIHEWFSIVGGVEDPTGIHEFVLNGRAKYNSINMAAWNSQFVIIFIVISSKIIGIFKLDAAGAGIWIVGIFGFIYITTMLAWVYKASDNWQGRLWYVGGTIYAGGMVWAICALRYSTDFGLTAILFLFFVVWGADVGAYFAGRAIGGPKLAPAISPNKTWSGLIGGLMTAGIAGSAVLMLMGVPLRPMHIVLAFILALVSAMGDLFESFFKRKFGVKDSSQLIPGHGGFMDRLDAFIFAAILAAMIGVARAGMDDVGGGLLAGW